MEPPAAIELEELTFAYGGDRPVFRELSLSIAAGTRCLLLGSNGVGKSTLLRIAAGRHMLPVETARVFGRSAFHDTTLTADVAFIGGPFPFAADISVGEILSRRSGVEPGRRRAVLEMLDVDPSWRMNRVSDGQKVYLHHLTAVCNRVACYTLRCAVNHIEATPLGTLEKDRGYLEGLTAHEKREETRLTNEVAQYYEWVHQDHSPIPGPVGGFEKSWTFYEGDREAARVGMHRLRARGRRVDDRKAPVAEGEPALRVDPGALLIGAAMRERGGHCGDHPLGRLSERVEAHESRDAAHGC